MEDQLHFEKVCQGKRGKEGRAAQNSSSGCEGWREKEEVSSNATQSTKQLKDKLWKVIYITHMKFLLL